MSRRLLSLLLNPNNERALFDLSQVYLRRHKNVAASLQAIDKFLAINPYHIGALFIKAERHYQLNELDNAQNTLDMVLVANRPLLWVVQLIPYGQVIVVQYIGS